MISISFLIGWIGFTVMMSLLVASPYLIPLWIVLGYAVGFLVLTLVLLIHLPLMMMTKPDHRYKYYLTRSTAFWVNHFVLRLHLEHEGLENLPETGPLTLYANHKSYADPFIMLELFKRPMTFTPKMAVFKIFLVGQWLKSMACFPIDRGSDRNTARAMVDAIKTVKNGMAMLIFPEGGIKDRHDEKMVAMRAGAYRVAMKSGADLLPIRIMGTTEIKHRAPWRNTKIKVIVFPVVKYNDIRGLSTADVADMMFNMINNGTNPHTDK
ncbi:MAG: 1-acyl-sn-glycerol-3-phosphate acyltransferase [Acholeplasmataceae bacterium]|nr:1-acyl-sn-glycerol-3-phosphate acyltransferase [Acholeplasmataceae bacterium]